MWCLPEDQTTYLARMEDVLELYERPHNAQEPVVCLDEKPVSLHAEVRSPEPARPGVVAKRDSEYKRKGTANVFCAVEPRAGRHFTVPTPRRTGAAFVTYWPCWPGAIPSLALFHLVLDNLNIHSREIADKPLRSGKRDASSWNRFTVHYTPKHGSSLNQAEIVIGLFARQCLGKRRLANFVDCWPKRTPGIVSLTVGRKSYQFGGSPGRMPAMYSTIRRTFSNGQRTSRLIRSQSSFLLYTRTRTCRACRRIFGR